MKIQEYIELYLAIHEKLVEINLNNDQVAICILQEIAKDRRMAEIEEKKKHKTLVNGTMPATEKQLDFLKELGVKAELPLTIQGASDLIEKTKKEKMLKLKII